MRSSPGRWKNPRRRLMKFWTLQFGKVRAKFCGILVYEQANLPLEESCLHCGFAAVFLHSCACRPPVNDPWSEPLRTGTGEHHGALC